ncbi:MAG: hypothetical protein WA603_03940 [Candidatus Acidiferrales bacterium]
MKRRIYKVATWLPLIVIVALGLRLGFAWEQERKIPRDLVGLVPFLQETGNIAFSIALGQGFGSPYWQETGPTAWLTPVYPYMVAGAYRIFGIHTPHAFFAMVLLNTLFSAATCIPIFYIGKRVGGWESRVLPRGFGQFSPTHGLFRTSGYGIRRFPRC